MWVSSSDRVTYRLAFHMVVVANLSTDMLALFKPLFVSHFANISLAKEIKFHVGGHGCSDEKNS